MAGGDAVGLVKKEPSREAELSVRKVEADRRGLLRRVAPSGRVRHREAIQARPTGRQTQDTPGSASESSRKRRRRCLGRGKPEPPCCLCEPDKQRKMR